MKKSIVRILFLFIICLFANTQNSSATHWAGGEITWRCVNEGGKSKYVFKLVIYRNCSYLFNGIPQPAAGVANQYSLQISNMNGVLSDALNNGRIQANGDIIVDSASFLDISPSCSSSPAGPLSCQGLDIGSIQKCEYVSKPIDFTGILPPSDPNSPIVISWNSCCRNGGIINIVNGQSGGESMYLLAKMYPYYPNGSTLAQPISECFDSSPDFSEPPSAILYTTGLDYFFNNNANDADLDNLYYDFSDPLLAEEELINGPLDIARTWTNYPYYNTTNPLGLQKDEYSFNNYTGEFTFKPLYSGDYVSSFKVSAYKCDQKVAEIFRDFQCRILLPDEGQNSNRFPDIFPPFKDAKGEPTSVLNVIAGNDILIPIVVRDSTAGGLAISTQELELSVNGAAMGQENADFNIGCPFPPCAVMTRNKGNYVYGPSNPKPDTIKNVPGEIFGYGYNLGASYSAGINDTIWLYWPTTCANLAKKNNCNGLESSRYNFVVTAKDNFCRVPGKLIKSFTINLLPPDFYLSPPIRCITYDQVTKQVILNWGVSTGDPLTFVRYEIYRENTLLFSTTNINTYNYVDFSPGASPDSTYYVRAVNLCNVEDEVSPVKPMKLEATFFRSNQARLVWNPIRIPNLKTAPTYKVFRSQTENPFNWVEIVDGDGINNNTSAIDNVNLCSDTTYYRVELFDSLSCTSYSTIDTIFHQTLFALVHTDTVCMNTPTSFYLDTLYGGVPPYITVRWLGDEGFNAGNEDTVYYAYPSYGKKAFTFTVIDSKGCRLDIIDTAFVRQLPEFELLKDSACPGSIINFGVKVNTSIPIDSVFWYGDFDPVSGTPLFIKEGPYFDPFYSAPKWIFSTNGGVGKFPVTLRLKDIYGCISTVIDTVNTGEPTIDILNDPSLCYDTKKDSIKIIPRYLTKPYNTVQWIDDNTGQVIYQANDGKDAMPLSVVAGRRYINLRVKIEDSKGCKGENIQQFTLSPWLDFLPDSVCIGDVANLRIVHKPISDTINYSYLWELDANTVATVREPEHIYTSNGPKIITLLVTDNITGCTTFIKDTLTVRDPMYFNITVDPNCAGEITTFRREVIAPTLETDVEWEWTVDEFPNVIPNNTITYTGSNVFQVLLPPSDGKFRVTLKMKDGSTGCFTEQDTVLKVFNQPDIDFDVDSLNCAGSVTQFISRVIGNSGPYLYSWVGEDDFIDTVANPVHTYPEEGDEYYLVSLSVTNNAGCVVTKTKNVRVCSDDRTFVQVPQIFSPGREKNNTLSLNFVNVDDFEITIYNRWGIEVFKSKDPNFVWDGKDLSGEYLLTGTYVYIVKANGSGKRNYLNKGTIAVLR
jgi:CHU_C Type IX secretion signal domain